MFFVCFVSTCCVMFTPCEFHVPRSPQISRGGWEGCSLRFDSTRDPPKYFILFPPWRVLRVIGKPAKFKSANVSSKELFPHSVSGRRTFALWFSSGHDISVCQHLVVEIFRKTAILSNAIWIAERATALLWIRPYFQH